MADQQVGFRIVLRNRAEDWKVGPEMSQGERRERFWRPLSQAGAPTADLPRDRSPEALERRFIRAMPNALREAFYGIFPTVAQDELFDRKSKSRQTPLIVFEVQDYRYGSLALDIGLEPITKLVEAFDNNFDYFFMALQGFVPAAVNQAFYHAVTTHSSASDPLDLYDVTVEPTPGLAAAFNAPGPIATSNQSGGWGAAAKANWTWIAANTSLIVPTLLAALYLFVIREDVREGERMRAGATEKILTEQTSLLNACGAILGQAVAKTTSAAPSGKPSGVASAAASPTAP